MSSPVPISTDEISQYQIETALDNFSNLKTKVGEAVRAFLASVKSDTAKITNETLTRFLETHLENLNILFTEELFSDPEFFKKLTSSESSDKQPSSTNTPDVDTLSNAIVKEILPSIYETNVQLPTSAAQSSSTPAVPTSNITESNSSTQIPSKNVTAISPQTSLTSIHQISCVSQMRTESTVLLGALAITLDKLQGITTTISRQAVASTTVATTAPLMLSKKISSIFKPKHKGLKLKNVFSKASILKVISPIGKMFTFLIKGSLKLLVGTVKLIEKGIVYVSKLIVNLAKTIIDLGKQVFKKIGQGLAGLFKLVKKAFVFSAKRIGKIFKAVFIDSKIGLRFLPYVLGFIYGYIKTKFFSDSTFIDSLINILPTLNINTPLTEKNIDAAKGLLANVEDAVDKSSPVPIPIQISANILDTVFEKLGIEINLQEKAIHITNVLGLLIKGKTEYDKTLAKAEEKRKERFADIDKSIETFGNENKGKGKLDILNEKVLTPFGILITDYVERATGLSTNLADIIQEKFNGISDAIKDFNLDDFTQQINKVISNNGADFLNTVANTLELFIGDIGELLGANAGGLVSGAILGGLAVAGITVSWPITLATVILGPLFGAKLGKYLIKDLQDQVRKLKIPKKYDSSHDAVLGKIGRYLLPKNDFNIPAETSSDNLTESLTGTDTSKPETPTIEEPDILPESNNPPLLLPTVIKQRLLTGKSNDYNKYSRVDVHKKFKELRESEIKNSSEKTKLTGQNIIKILTNPTISLGELEDNEFNVKEDWVDTIKFRNIRSLIFESFIKKIIDNSGDSDKNKPFDISHLSQITQLFMDLSDPLSPVYTTLMPDVRDLLQNELYGQFSGTRNDTFGVANILLYLQKSPITDLLPQIGKRNASYLKGLPLGILFNKIVEDEDLPYNDDRRIDLGIRGLNLDNVKGIFKNIASNNLTPFKNNPERQYTTTEIVMSDFAAKGLIDLQKFDSANSSTERQSQLDELFPPPDPEDENLKKKMETEVEKTKKLNEAKLKKPTENLLAANISTSAPPTPPVTNDFENSNYRFGDTSNIHNNIFFRPVQFFG